MGDPADIGPQYQCPTCFAWSPAESCERCDAQTMAGASSPGASVAAPLTIDGQVVTPGKVIVYGHVRTKRKGKTLTGGVYSVSIDMVLSPGAYAALQQAIDEMPGPKDGNQ